MKSRTKIYLFLSVLILSLLVVTPAFAFQGETQPPTIEQFPLLKNLLEAGIGFIVALGIKSIASEFGIDLKDKAMSVTGALSITAIAFIDQILAKTPPEYYPVVVSALGLLVSILMAFGFAGLVKKFQKRTL